MLRTPNDVSDEELAAALERLQNSVLFKGSADHLKLLRFLMETGKRSPHLLRETYIATAFYDRDSSYDPRMGSLVRVSLRRLRRRLDQHYAGAGAQDPVRISIPAGSYVPLVTRSGPALAENHAGSPLVSVPLNGLGAAGSSAGISEPARELPSAAAFGEPGRASAAGSTLHGTLTWAATLLFFVCGGTFAFVLARSHAASAPVALTDHMPEIPLTMGRDLEFEPATTADGKQLAYVSRLPGSKRFRIFVRDFLPNSGAERALDTGQENALYPAWSPDGRRIAFLRCGTGPCEVAVVPVNGGTVQSVHVLPSYALPDDQGYYQYRQLNPVWTADGKGLIYPYRGEQDQAERLVYQALGSAAQVQLTFGEPADEDAAPSLSADGQSVAFLRRHLTRTEVRVLDLRSRQSRVLETEPNAIPTNVTWTPDGQGVVICSSRREGNTLLYIPLQGQPRMVSVRPPVPMSPAFARDGKTLMFVSANRTRNLAEVIGAQGRPTPVFPSKQKNTFIALSPDGRTLAFLSDRSGGFELWISHRNGSVFQRPTQLTHGLGWYPASITWAPDGKMLAVGISNSHEIDLVTTETGAINHLPLPGLEQCDVWSPVWSADGHWIYLSAWGEKDGIFRASTGRAPGVEEIWAGRARELRLDGDRALYFSPNYGTGVYRLALQAGARPAAVPELAGVQPSRAWLVQGGRLLFMNAYEEVTRLHALDLATRKVSEVTGALPRVAFADGTLSYVEAQHLLLYSEWSPDAGSQIVGLRWQ